MKKPKVVYNTEADNTVFEQLNFNYSREIYIVGWKAEHWNKYRSNTSDPYRVAIFKPKTQPNK